MLIKVIQQPLLDKLSGVPAFNTLRKAQNMHVVSSESMTWAICKPKPCLFFFNRFNFAYIIAKSFSPIYQSLYLSAQPGCSSETGGEGFTSETGENNPLVTFNNFLCLTCTLIFYYSNELQAGSLHPLSQFENSTAVRTHHFFTVFLE